MGVDLANLRQWIAIGNQTFIVQGQCLLHIFERLGNGTAGGEATRYVRDDHSVV